MNKNFFRKKNHRILFPTNGLYDNLNAFCKGCSFPSLSKNEIMMQKNAKRGYLNDLSVTLGQIDFSFYLDEDFKVYEEMYKWFTESTPIDIMIMILSNKHNTIKEFKLENVFPTDLASIELDVQEDGNEPTILTLSCVLDEFKPIL